MLSQRGGSGGDLIEELGNSILTRRKRERSGGSPLLRDVSILDAFKVGFWSDHETNGILSATYARIDSGATV